MKDHDDAGSATHLGIIHHVTNSSIYIRPLEPLPTNMSATMLKLGVYASLSDIADADFVPVIGMRVEF